MIDRQKEQPGPATTPHTQAKARHILDNYFIGPARDKSVLEIWAYTERFSYFPGETLALHASTTAALWDLEIGRDGAEYEKLLTVVDLPGQHHPTPQDCSVTPLQQYYDPSDFLTTILASSLFRLVRRYCLPWQSSEDLPRSPGCFDDMPCSQTPGMPDTAAQLAIPDSVFWSS